MDNQALLIGATEIFNLMILSAMGGKLLEVEKKMKNLSSIGSVLCEHNTRASEYRRQGEWEKLPHDPFYRPYGVWYRCSACNNENLGKTEYCPCCGAKMKGVCDE